MTGFVKLHRELAEWEWYDDHNATRLLIHLLISVNYKDKKWRGMVIKRGSMVFSWDTLSDGCGLSKQQCRTAMKKLIESGEVTRQATNKYQVVSLVKWDKMQIEEVGNNTQPNKQVTGKQQTNNRLITPTKEGKESKEDNKLTLMERVGEFKNSLRPYVDQYGREMLTDFFEYWTEHGENDKKFRAEKETSFSVERRLKTWHKNQKRFEKEKSPAKKEKVNAGTIAKEKIKSWS